MTSKVPQKFKALFWDINFSALDVQNHKRFIIERLLEKGDFQSLKWLFTAYSEPEVKDVIIASNNLSTGTISFWNIYFA